MTPARVLRAAAFFVLSAALASGCRCDPDRGVRLESELSTSGLRVHYRYAQGTDELIALDLRMNGEPAQEVLLAGQPSPSFYPPRQRDIYAEVMLDYFLSRVETVEYVRGAVGSDPSSPVAVEVIEAVYYENPAEPHRRASYDYLVFGDPRLHDQFARLHRIVYFDAAGRMRATLSFEYDAQGDVTRTRYAALTADATELDFTRETEYAWDGRPPAERYRFLARFMPEGELIGYSHLARSNLAWMHTTTRDAAGNVTQDQTIQLVLSYHDGRLQSVQTPWVGWDLTYEEYELD